MDTVEANCMDFMVISKLAKFLAVQPPVGTGQLSRLPGWRSWPIQCAALSQQLGAKTLDPWTHL
jgi:hypothetical protein